MNKARMNEVMQDLDQKYNDALETVCGQRKAYDKLYAAHRQVSAALVDLENRWYLRLLRWVCRRPAPSDAMLGKESE